jgi:hypothetical protein
MQTVYVFALTSAAVPPFAIGSHRVEFLDLDGLHAAIERRAERLVISESSLRSQHDIVSRLFDQIDAVIPARFGALIDERELHDIVAVRRSVILDTLSLVRGRVQMTVRFRGAPESTATSARPAQREGMSGTAYLEARLRAARTMPSVARIVTEAVTHLVIAGRSEAGTDRAPSTLYHLIDRGSVTAYSDVMSSLKLPAVTVSGPWPAFAFAPDLWP